MRQKHVHTNTYMALARQLREHDGDERLAENEHNPEHLPLNVVPDVDAHAVARPQCCHRIQEKLYNERKCPERGHDLAVVVVAADNGSSNPEYNANRKSNSIRDAEILEVVSKAEADIGMCVSKHDASEQRAGEGCMKACSCSLTLQLSCRRLRW